MNNPVQYMYWASNIWQIVNISVEQSFQALCPQASLELDYRWMGVWVEKQANTVLRSTQSTARMNTVSQPFMTEWPYLYSISLYLGRRNVLWSPKFDCNYYIGSSPCASPMVRTFHHIYIAHQCDSTTISKNKTKKIEKKLLNFMAILARVLP